MSAPEYKGKHTKKLQIIDFFPPWYWEDYNLIDFNIPLKIDILLQIWKNMCISPEINTNSVTCVMSSREIIYITSRKKVVLDFPCVFHLALMYSIPRICIWTNNWRFRNFFYLSNVLVPTLMVNDTLFLTILQIHNSSTNINNWNSTINTSISQPNTTTYTNMYWTKSWFWRYQPQILNTYFTNAYMHFGIRSHFYQYKLDSPVPPCISVHHEYTSCKICTIATLLHVRIWTIATLLSLCNLALLFLNDRGTHAVMTQLRVLFMSQYTHTYRNSTTFH